MANPKPSEPQSLGVDERRLKVLAEQFVADAALLPEEVLVELAALVDGKAEGVAPLEAVRSHLGESPRRIRVMMPVGLPKMPYYKLLEPVDVLGARLLEARFIQDVVVLLGEARVHLFLLYLSDKHAFLSGVPPRLIELGRDLKPSPPPDQAKVDALWAGFEAQRIPLTEAMRADLSNRATAAEQSLERERKREAAERSLRAEQLGRANEEHRRGKERAAADAKKAAEDGFAKERKAWEGRESGLLAQVAALESQLADIRGRAPVAGISPADLDRITAELRREHEGLLEAWKDATVRPWMDRLTRAEAAYGLARDAVALSEKAVEHANAEATKDLLANWEAEPLRALPLIEARLKTVDDLVASTLKPSQALLKVHTALRKALDGCRAEVERIKGEKPATLMVGAISATIKSMDFDSLSQIAASINFLAEKGALTEAEADQISRKINDEVALRQARQEHVMSPRTLLMADLHGGKQVEILIDSYNFMHLAKQHFGSMGRPGNFDPTRKTFGPDARAKLASLVKVLTEKFPKVTVRLFLDGQNMEKECPYERVRFIRPTVQREGEGQADAQIVDFIKRNAQTKASIYVVSCDRQVQDVANRHLSVGIFCQLLIDI